MYTLEECRKAWKEAGGHGSKEERIARNLCWMEYYHYLASLQENSQAQFDFHAEKTVKFLMQQEFLNESSTVLDIGCGTGRYSLELAKRCSSVTAVDMDASSLSVLQDHAKQLNIQNITYRQEMWETFETQKKHSVVFSSMCPAICDDEELRKMESLQKNHVA